MGSPGLPLRPPGFGRCDPRMGSSGPLLESQPRVKKRSWEIIRSPGGARIIDHFSGLTDGRSQNSQTHQPSPSLQSIHALAGAAFIPGHVGVPSDQRKQPDRDETATAAHRSAVVVNDPRRKNGPAACNKKPPTNRTKPSRASERWRTRLYASCCGKRTETYSGIRPPPRLFLEPLYESPRAV
jgi:hypothetical protein